MYHDIFPFFEHVLVGKDIVLENAPIGKGKIVNQLLTILMSQCIGHLISIDPIISKHFRLFLRDLCRTPICVVHPVLNFLKDDIILDYLLVLEEDPFNLMEGMFIDLELFRYGWLLVDCLLHDQSHALLEFLLFPVFLFLHRLACPLVLIGLLVVGRCWELLEHAY